METCPETTACWEQVWQQKELYKAGPNTSINSENVQKGLKVQLKWISQVLMEDKTLFAFTQKEAILKSLRGLILSWFLWLWLEKVPGCCEDKLELKVYKGNQFFLFLCNKCSAGQAQMCSSEVVVVIRRFIFIIQWWSLNIFISIVFSVKIPKGDIFMLDKGAKVFATDCSQAAQVQKLKFVKEIWTASIARGIN